MVWRPKGLLAHRDPTILLHPKRSARQQQADSEAGE
jgi:branched-chain amino acid transport system permease protein